MKNYITATALALVIGLVSVNAHAVSKVAPTVDKVAPVSKVDLTPRSEKNIYEAVAREAPGAEPYSAMMNRRKKCEESGGTWVGTTWIIGQQANGGLGGIQIIPGHCNAAATTNGATN